MSADPNNGLKRGSIAEEPESQDKPLQVPGLCAAAEEFATRLSEQGGLAYEEFPSDFLFLRSVKKENIEVAVAKTPKKLYNVLLCPDNKYEPYRYTGKGHDHNPATDAMYVGALDAADRELMYYADSKKLILPQSAFRLSPLILGRSEYFLLAAKRKILLPSVNRTLLAHQTDDTLRSIERRFRIDALAALDDPADYSFTRGLGRGLSKRQAGLVFQTARRFLGESGPGLRNVVFFGQGGKEISCLKVEGKITFTNAGIPPPGFAQILKR